MEHYVTRPGSRYPFGARADEHGANFSLWSQHATGVELLLYEGARSPEPFQVIRLDPEMHRTFYSWHVYVEGLPVGTHYTWRVDGPSGPMFRFDSSKELLDPWARAISPVLWDRDQARLPGDNRTHAMRAVVLDGDGYDWEGDAPLHAPSESMIVYEMHVGGFTRHPSSGVRHPGTFSAVVEKIPYLQALGITHVELMPVMAFDEQDVPEGVAARGLGNFWGYSPHSFFAPHPGYCAHPEGEEHRREFRDMVKALHGAGIGVIIDVVFNHTSEAGHDGPTIHFKGLDNPVFYHLDYANPGRYRDYTGCGNTVNCNHPVVSKFIVDYLEYWVEEMHLDGFRFDLASVLARAQDGSPHYHAHAPWNIEFSDILAQTEIIAEAWDAGGLYQVGNFPGFRWSEWNGKYRDTLRCFVRGDGGIIGDVASRVAGSSDLYEPGGRLPINSVNFVTCHDGFTLWDLVSYNWKHNLANGEDDRDGNSDNMGWNCGVEGETHDPDVLALRRRQARNLTALLLLSQGVPMLLSGDEVLRTQRGNNNVWCQDNDLGWFDWDLVEKNADMLRFTRGMIALRRRHPCLMRRRYLTGRMREGMRMADVSWHGAELYHPRWEDGGTRVLGWTLGGCDEAEEDVHVMVNMADQPVTMAIPPVTGRGWYRAIDTARASPFDVVEPGQQEQVMEAAYRLQPRSVVVLESRPL